MPNIITIPTPCHEDWNTMTPKDQGRHCGSCCKTVVDFTTWEPQDILLHFQSNKNVCGRFTVDQLNEPIPSEEDFVKQISYFNISTIKKMAAIFLFAFMIGGTSCNENTDYIGKSLVAITTNNIDNVPIETLIGDTTYNIPNPTMLSAPIATEIIDMPHIKGRSVITKAPKIIGNQNKVGLVEVVEPTMLMGEPAIVDTTKKAKTTCTSIVDENEHFVMGKIAMPRVDSTKKNN
jgi:hypothetical protein